MPIIIVVLPALSAICCFMFGLSLGKRGAILISLSSLAISLILCLRVGFDMLTSNKQIYIKLSTWLCVGPQEINLGFTIDTLAVSMTAMVLIISILVHLYSVAYMEGDPHIVQFMGLLSIFTFFMLTLVVAPNFVQLFFGWEGVGICSYLLINFWHTRPQANKSALKAILVNRIGDAAILVAMITCLTTATTTDIAPFFAIGPFIGATKLVAIAPPINTLTIVALMLLIGVAAKSAQLGFHTWLPDAMEGPTPVSALIHAATMVTAGVFVMLRFAVIFEGAPSVMHAASLLGAATAVYAASISIFQYDIKKIIAYSTCSQLGYMVLIAGLSHYNIALYHLLNHAFFKALLFLTAGAILHSLNDEQDIRKMGGMPRILPLELSALAIASAALAGVPFLAGFYSKDLIIEITRGTPTPMAYTAFFAGLTAAMLTAIYSVRLIYYVFFTKTNAFKQIARAIGNNKAPVEITLVTLTILSIFSGYLLHDIFVASSLAQRSFAIETCYTNEFIAETIPIIAKILPVLGSVCGPLIFLAIRQKLSLPLVLIATTNIIRTVSYEWHFDDIYNSLFVKKVLGFAYNNVVASFDRGFLELLGPMGLKTILQRISYSVLSLHTGVFTQFFLIQAVGMAAIFITAYVVS